MIRINLLPHREENRKARRQQFFLLSALMVVAGLFVWFVGHTILGGYLSGQDAKNAFLKEEIAALDKDIVEIKRLREQSEALLSRKQVIESLQTHRTETVAVFNELARLMPEGVYLKALKETGATINLQGFAQSNARVSMLMRNLDGSQYLERPELVEVKAAMVNNRRVSEFNMNVSVKRNKADGPGAKGKSDVPQAGGKS